MRLIFANFFQLFLCYTVRHETNTKHHTAPCSYRSGRAQEFSCGLGGYDSRNLSVDSLRAATRARGSTDRTVWSKAQRGYTMNRVLNAFESCRPRGPDAPAYTPPVRKPGKGGSLAAPQRVLNAAGHLQATLEPAGRGSGAYALRVDPAQVNKPPAKKKRLLPLKI